MDMSEEVDVFIERVVTGSRELVDYYICVADSNHFLFEQY